MNTTMHVWRRETYGPASGVELAKISVPRPGRGQVLVQIEATALNAADVRLLLGDPLLVRPFFGLTRPKQPVRGLDIVGTVRECGPDTPGIEVGARVVAELQGGGGLAAFAVVDVSRAVPLPHGVQPDAAACLPVAGGTAWQALDLAKVERDASRPQRVLVLGASGGVGTFAVQLAILRGAEVWATCAQRNAAVIDGLGAAHTLDHRRTPLSTLRAGYFDAVIDIAGGVPLRELQRITADGGRAVLVVGDGGRILGPVPRMLRAAFVSLGSSRAVKSLAATSRPEILAGLLELVAARRIAPVIERTYAFADTPKALAHVESGHTVGKVVVLADQGVSPTR